GAGRRGSFWALPANVSGRWNVELSGAGDSAKVSFNFDQKFQKIEGSVYLGPVIAGLREPRLSGARISFAYVDAKGVRRDFTGRVAGPAMDGTFRTDGGQEGRWTAAKK